MKGAVLGMLGLGLIGVAAARGQARSRAERRGAKNEEHAKRELPGCLGHEIDGVPLHDGDHFYHATAFDNVAAIARSGLTPSTGERLNFGHQRAWSYGKIFLAAGENPGTAWWRTLRNNGIADPVLLRVDRSVVLGLPVFTDPPGSSDIECSFYVKTAIPASAISFYDPQTRAYVPVEKWKAFTSRKPSAYANGEGPRDETYCPAWGAADPEWEEEGAWE